MAALSSEQMEQWAKENLRTFDDYYEAFVGLQRAVDGAALVGVGWGDHVFRHTGRGINKVAKEQKRPRPIQNPSQDVQPLAAGQLKSKLLR